MLIREVGAMSINAINTNSATNVQQTYTSQQSGGVPTNVTESQAATLEEDTVTFSSSALAANNGGNTTNGGSWGVLPPE